MKNRYTAPFGYAIIKGVTEIHPKEASVVRQIFAEYNAGASLKSIAQDLATRKIEYIPGTSDWNINRVKRILEDVRYTGSSGLPSIIDVNTYIRTGATKTERTKQPEKKSPRPVCPVVCASCGEKMKRLHDVRWEISEIWLCGCGTKARISDNDLCDVLFKILNRLIKQPDLIMVEPAEEQETPLNLVAMQNEISRQLEGFDFDRDKVKGSIFELAALKYSQLDNRKNTTKQLRAELTQMAPLSGFSSNILGRVSSKIVLSEPANVQVELKNGQLIGKDENDERDSDPG